MGISFQIYPSCAIGGGGDCVWRARNRLCFDAKEIVAEDVGYRAIEELREYQLKLLLLQGSLQVQLRCVPRFG